MDDVEGTRPGLGDTDGDCCNFANRFKRIWCRSFSSTLQDAQDKHTRSASSCGLDDIVIKGQVKKLKCISQKAEVQDIVSGFGRDHSAHATSDMGEIAHVVERLHRASVAVESLSKGKGAEVVTVSPLRCSFSLA